MSTTGRSERSRQPPSFQLDEDPAFQSRMWRIQRIGWWSIAGILLAAAAGFFGHGPLSRASLELTDDPKPAKAMTLEYERFGRAHRESRFIVYHPAGPSQAHTFSLWLSGEYLTDVEVLRITPDPLSQEPVSNGVRYRFHLDKQAQTVMFRFKPERGGILSGSFRMNDGPPVTFRQWLFP
jgi:hypothetical protein